jgi:hypothetical protein
MRSGHCVVDDSAAVGNATGSSFVPTHSLALTGSEILAKRPLLYSGRSGTAHPLADIDTLIWPAAVADVCKRNQAAADGARTRQNNAAVKMREKVKASALIEMIPFRGEP